MAIISGRQPQGKFVFKKQNKIRWKRSQFPNDDVMPTASMFVSGSWDDAVRNKCTVLNYDNIP